MNILIETSTLQSQETVEKSLDQILALLIQDSTSLNANTFTTSLQFICKNTSKDAANSNNKHTGKVLSDLLQIFLKLKGDDLIGKQREVANTLVSIIKDHSDETTLLKRNYTLIGLWKPFVVNILKNHFMDTEFMGLLNVTVECFYKNGIGKKSDVSLKDIHDMVVGHSKFLTVLIDENGEHTKSKGMVTYLFILHCSPTTLNLICIIPFGYHSNWVAFC